MIARALLTGIIAAAATSGALLGFGVRAGTPARAFNAIASFLIGDRAHGLWGWEGTVTPTGIAVHVAMTVGWSALFAAMTIRLRGWRLLVAALVVACGALVVNAALVQRRAGPGSAEVLGPGQLVGLHLILAVSLAMGMRFARTARRSDSRHRAAPPEFDVT